MPTASLCLSGEDSRKAQETKQVECKYRRLPSLDVSQSNPRCRTWELFFQSPENRACCVVTHFLALAIADGALTMAAITNAKIDPGANSKILAFPEKVQELPIIRAMDRDQHSISATNILTFAVWNSCLVNLGERAGYEEKLTSYCFRRGVGNALDSMYASLNRARYEY